MSIFICLDFLPIQSSLLPAQLSGLNSILLGGRYCSIKGETAAQLRYQSSANANLTQSASTLFQVPFELDMHGEIPNIAEGKPELLQVKGLDVSLWVERGLLMVLVQEP